MQHDLESIFRTAHRELRPRTPIPEIKIEFFPFAGLNHTVRLNDNRMVVRVSDIFTDAPADIYHSLALILFGKLYRKKIDDSYHRTYRTFILSEPIQERARVIRNDRCRSPKRYWMTVLMRNSAARIFSQRASVLAKTSEPRNAPVTAPGRYQRTIRHSM